MHDVFVEKKKNKWFYFIFYNINRIRYKSYNIDIFLK